MDKQQVFDKVVNHLRKQGRKAIGAGGTCVYRAPDGSKCAFGCLIEDSEYSPDMEYMNSTVILNATKTSALSLIKRLKQHDELIRDLQVVHDNNFPEEWEDGFAKIAARYKLTFTPLQK